MGKGVSLTELAVEVALTVALEDTNEKVSVVTSCRRANELMMLSERRADEGTVTGVGIVSV